MSTRGCWKSRASKRSAAHRIARQNSRLSCAKSTPASAYSIGVTSFYATPCILRNRHLKGKHAQQPWGSALQSGAYCITAPLHRFIAEEAFSFRIRELAPDALRVLDMQDCHALRSGKPSAPYQWCQIMAAALRSAIIYRTSTKAPHGKHAKPGADAYAACQGGRRC